MRLLRLLPLLAAVVAVCATPASGDVSTRKQAVDARLARVQAKIAWAQQREQTLAAQIADVNGQIRGLAQQVGVVSNELAPLERDLELHREKLARLTELFKLQTDRFHFYRGEYQALIDRLGNRLVDLYEHGEPNALEVVFDSSSVTDVIDQVQVVESLGAQDTSIATQVGTAKERVRAQREHTKRFRSLVAAELRTIAVRTNQVRALRDRLLASQSRLAAARANKRDALQNVKETKGEFLHEAAGLQAASASLAAQIRSAQARSSYSAPADSTPSAAGFIWPVNGPVTSGFGMRWGRMHEGIDIGAGYGTPIHAAAAGRVVYAGWMSGYGNLVAIDNGGGISTAYGHQSSIGVSVGEIVAQGQTVGYVGCTGHCFGPHLHFEVRVNGAPVDPLGYL
jgi:murein DD-endopeptidase MepM/ murein hydrolase activator NlpD